MIIWTRPPSECLSPYIEIYWYLHQKTHERVFCRLSPDAGSHVILAMPDQEYCYQGSERAFSGKGSHILFSHTTYSTFRHEQGYRCLGIKLKPHTLYMLGESDLTSRLNQVLPLAESPFANLTSGIETTLNFSSLGLERCVSNLEQVMKNVFTLSDANRHTQLVQRALGHIDSNRQVQISSELGCSQRTLERSFKAVTGLTLKQYINISKLNNVLTRLNRHAGLQIEWSELAQEFGFADQAHFIRYLKNAIGHTPQGYIRQRDLTIDIYGNGETG